KSHEKTGESAGRLLERIVNGDVSDVGESDEEDDTFETNACQKPEQANDVENEEAAGEDANEDEESTADVPCTSVTWKKKRYTPPQDTGFSARGDLAVTADETSTPLTYFSRYVPQSVFKGITEATNEYSALTSHTNINTSPDEVRKLVEMHVLMGVISLPRDNNCVTIASNFVGIGEQKEVSRWDKEKKQHILVKQPEVIKKYNHSMGAVDKLDFLLSLYRIKIRSRKWTLRVLFHFVGIAICNAWLEYLRDNEGIPRTKLMDLIHFRLQVAEGLIKAVPNARKRGRPSLENLDLQAGEATKVLKKPKKSRPCADSRTPVYEMQGPKQYIALPRGPEGSKFVPQAQLNHQDPPFPRHGFKPRTARRGWVNPHGSGFAVMPLTKHLLKQVPPACGYGGPRGGGQW
ncbi:hypothetical protein HPB47_027873, partial [Ixodes persulcatus]